MAEQVVSEEQAIPGETCIDPFNALLKETPSQLATAIADTPNGQRLILTIRTASGTNTVMLDKKSGKQWGANITTMASNMSDLEVVSSDKAQSVLALPAGSGGT